MEALAAAAHQQQADVEASSRSRLAAAEEAVKSATARSETNHQQVLCHQLCHLAFDACMKVEVIICGSFKRGHLAHPQI